MALKNEQAESWNGETRNIVLNNITDSDGVVLNWSTATAVTMKVTTEQGQGNTVMTITESAMTRTSTKVTIPVTDSDWGAYTAGEYYWELAANWGSGLQQIVAPSLYTFHASTT